jgi:hypothetical protein
MRRRANIVAVLLSVGALGLSACGGSDEPASTSAAADAADNGGSEDDGGDAAAFDACKELPAEVVGKIIGATLTSEVGPFDVCEYDQEDVRATSVAIGSQPAADLGGGFDVYKSGSAGALNDSVVKDLPGIGEEAFVVTGKFGDGESIQLQGAALVDGLVITVNLTQASGLGADTLVTQATELLELAATKV